MVTSGLRIGTSALATRGFAVDAFAEVSDVIAQCLTRDPDEGLTAKLTSRVAALAEQHPLYPALTG
jgi:glycine hydroxymethyltransferase